MGHSIRGQDIATTFALASLCFCVSGSYHTCVIALTTELCYSVVLWNIGVSCFSKLNPTSKGKDFSPLENCREYAVVCEYSKRSFLNCWNNGKLTGKSPCSPGLISINVGLLFRWWNHRYLLLNMVYFMATVHRLLGIGLVFSCFTETITLRSWPLLVFFMESEVMYFPFGF